MPEDESLYLALNRKKKEMENEVRQYERTLEQLNDDIVNLKEGNSMMTYLENIDVTLADVPKMNLLFVRKMVQESDFEKEYGSCFGQLFRKIADDKLTVTAPPMVLFHSAEFSPLGLDTEFAVPVEEYLSLIHISPFSSGRFPCLPAALPPAENSVRQSTAKLHPG